MMTHQSEVRDASVRQQDAEQSSGESSGLVAQELRTQITLMAKVLLEYKANTDPLSTQKWLELVCCAAAVPERETVLPNTGELENMDYRQLSKVLEEMASKLENEKGTGTVGSGRYMKKAASERRQSGSQQQ